MWTWEVSPSHNRPFVTFQKRDRKWNLTQKSCLLSLRMPPLRTLYGYRDIKKKEGILECTFHDTLLVILSLYNFFSRIRLKSLIFHKNFTSQSHSTQETFVV